jgi:hypothetical protein
MSAIRRFVVNGGFHHRSIRKTWLMAEASNASSAEFDGKNLGRNSCHLTTKTVELNGRNAF